MTVTFAEKLSRIPHYEPGTSLDDAKAQAETADAIKLASNESPVPAAPDGGRGDRAGGRGRQPLPGPGGACPPQGGSPSAHETDPARIAVSNGSCEILLAAALALCEPGDEILYAWPSFSIYPYLPALSGAREIRVPLDGRLRPRPRRDARGGDRGDPAADRLQPEQPDGDLPARSSGSRLPRERARSRTTVIVDEAYIEFQTERRPRRDARPARRSTRTSSCCARSASATGWPGCGSATRSARRSSARRSTPCASRSASTRSRRPPRAEAILPPGRRRRPRREEPGRARLRRGGPA